MIAPTFRVVKVTPSIATRWIANSTGQRSVSEPHVNFLADEILNDRWQLSQDAVVIDINGVLINGQHRAHAVVKSGRVAIMWVIENADPKMKEIIDLNRVRSIPDMLKMIYGVDRSRMITGAARLIDLYVKQRNIKLSTGHALDLIAEYDGAWKWAVKSLPGKSMMVISPIVAALVYAHLTSPHHIEEFSRRITTNTNLNDESPALAFVRYVNERRGMFTTKEDKRECFCICLQAIKKHIKGQRVKLLRREDSSVFEYFGAAYKAAAAKRVG